MSHQYESLMKNTNLGGGNSHNPLLR
jgi:hypothetical protein